MSTTEAQRSVDRARLLHLNDVEARLNSEIRTTRQKRYALVKESFPIGTRIRAARSGALYLVNGWDEDQVTLSRISCCENIRIHWSTCPSNEFKFDTP